MHRGVEFTGVRALGYLFELSFDAEDRFTAATCSAARYTELMYTAKSPYGLLILSTFVYLYFFFSFAAFLWLSLLVLVSHALMIFRVQKVCLVLKIAFL